MMNPRPEYPRPQLARDEWLNLNGTWGFAFDDDDCGLVERWFEPKRAQQFPLDINVPFVYQTPLSGINSREFHNIVWYHRSFRTPQEWLDRHVMLHFGAVDYRAWVWLNGHFVTYHEGGHTPFQADITPLLREHNDLVVRVEDIATDLTQPRGKQFWKEQSEGIFYTQSTGIWQAVWLEPVDPVHIKRVYVTPDVATNTVTITCDASQRVPAKVMVEVAFDSELVATAGIELASNGHGSTVVSIPNARLWTPEQPNLYDVTIQMSMGGKQCDEVRTYFGMRDVTVENGLFMLNGAPYMMKLVLDQGYHPDGLLTPPTDDAIRRDVELVKAMGFNGVRKHQKVEDPRYLYWADRLGLLVWGEMANCYRYSEVAVQRLLAEWQEVIQRDYNHPSIVAWVPLNESWGVPKLNEDERQVNFLRTLYHLTKALDATRPVMSNDGWEHVRADLCTIHDYTSDPAVLAARYGILEQALAYCPSERVLYMNGCQYSGEPIVISECGGIAYRTNEWEGWGYSRVSNAEDFCAEYHRLISTLLAAPLIQGFCYTQFVDVEQEINGLLTYDRQPKVPLETIRAINEGRWIESTKFNGNGNGNGTHKTVVAAERTPEEILAKVGPEPLSTEFG